MAACTLFVTADISNAPTKQFEVAQRGMI
ncbi:PhrC/PhrF family phosphatase-inhibitory pheromone [Bacillus atrophaeus]|nr:PhrC/PhrF family phosphatase-inhibitory pheromone [Bacillus atrophaeus]MEC2396887.1 PhrC/PhrF family phosphatase-inhibitory pheromone [Bacillus atrophaeus]MED4436542.1 PhrC/PhrF family phosphatase-inhibitory pheromone [Bacillus atrophaeus]MED4564604.1 PhrC/PhrF family phosphatase-inhibitory pheromone [Bacillus atrophaeus]MED4574811.1 PhrC/PhrF family phosphatase-inhibitory pheromone [Bacillus atrophaeus]